MSALKRFQFAVDDTLGRLFPSERQAHGVILARITESEGGSLECDLRAPDEYVLEIVNALQSKLVGWDYTLKIRRL